MVKVDYLRIMLNRVLEAPENLISVFFYAAVHGSCGAW